MTNMPRVSKGLLEVDGLGVTFSGIPIVKNVSFHLDSGEVLGIVGESGSGKSVTCRSLLGLLPSYATTDGKIRFDRQNLLDLPDAQMRAIRGRHMSMIFQNPASHLDPLRTIGHHIAEPIRLHANATRRGILQQVVDVLDAVGIIDPQKRVNAYPHELSGGMKQRAMIGGAIACKPRILVADEPTTALDVTVQARILEVLRTLNKKHGLSIILVSHDLAVVSQICDRVLVMKQGEIVEQGRTDEILLRPQHEYTKLLIASQPERIELPITSAIRSPKAIEPIFQIHNLDITYQTGSLIRRSKDKAIHALQDVSLTIEEGECFGVVGESGSGKSTIAKALMKLVEPTAGRITFSGEDITMLHGIRLTGYRRQVQMAFQNPFDSLNPHMRIVDAIAEPLLRHGLMNKTQARDMALAMMRQVELAEDLAERKPKQLSGGQCQRVGIARSLILNPRVLIADEITSSLDVTIQAQIIRLLARLREERNLTIIYISHDLNVVRKLCNRIAVFNASKLIEIGQTQTVLDHPQSDYTKQLVASVPQMQTLSTPGSL